MDYQPWLEFAALGVASASLAMTYLRTARMQGGERQRVKALEDSFQKLATAESVAALASRLDALEGEVRLIATALAKVAVIDVRLDGLDRLMSTQLEAISHALRGLEGRPFDAPSGGSRGRRATAG
jgi:hypothetical protein